MAQCLLLSLHSMVLELLSRGVLTYDFVAGVTVRKASRYDEPVVIPTEREVQELLSAADRLANSKNKQTQGTWARYRPMLYLAADSGMRPQEYIVVPEFNIHENGVQVDRALESGDRRITVTKTPAGRRFIDLSPETIDMVRHYSRTHEVPASKNSERLVFPTSSGRWQSPDNWRKRGFAAVCEEAGLGEERRAGKETIFVPRFTPYSLRHFYASMLIEQRVNLKRIQKLMGHEKIETTLNFYGHLIERTEAETEVGTGMLASLRREACGVSVALADQAVE
jgi:integrase